MEQGIEHSLINETLTAYDDLENVPLNDLKLPESKLRELCLRLPKVDLHYHLEGGHGIAPEILLPPATKHGVPLPADEVEKLRPFVQVTSEDKTLLDFLKKFETIGTLFTSTNFIEDLTYHTIEQVSRDNVIYLELRFSPYYIAQAHQLPLDDVMNAVIDGVNRAAQSYNTKVNLILIVERQKGLDPAWQVERLEERYSDKGVVALDLANDELRYRPGQYAEVFQKGKQAGRKRTAHAGEPGDEEIGEVTAAENISPRVNEESIAAANIREAILKLGADRIGHGTQAFKDPAVEQMLLERGIPLEMCLTSNVQTGAVVSIQEHPFLRYFRKGIRVTLNTDDPGISRIDLSDDIINAAKAFNLTFGDLFQIELNGVEAAFLSDEERGVLAQKIIDQFHECREWLVEELRTKN